MGIPLIPTQADRSQAGLLLLHREWDALGWMFPRFILQLAEIHAWPTKVGVLDSSDHIDFWRSRRVALVRQSAYGGPYPPTPAANWTDRVCLAGKHLGPFSFLSDLDADYLVVRQATEPETYLWKGKYSLDPDPQKSYERVFRKIRDWEATAEGKSAVFVDDIDWSQYDLVVGLDVPVPGRIAKKCPQTLWAYYSIEAGGPLQKNSLRQAVPGYHLFLNHCFRRFPCRPRNRSHVLEFPFTFQSRRAWEELARYVGLEGCARKNQVVLDRASTPPSQPGSRLFLHHLGGNGSQNPARAYLGQMTSSSFAIRTDPKTRWGNWAVEAIQAGCLFLGRADSLAMPGILLPGLIAETTDQAWAKAEELLDRPEELDLLLRLQGALADYLCFQRPLADLTHRARSFLSR